MKISDAIEIFIKQQKLSFKDEEKCEHSLLVLSDFVLDSFLKTNNIKTLPFTKLLGKCIRIVGNVINEKVNEDIHEKMNTFVEKHIRSSLDAKYEDYSNSVSCFRQLTSVCIWHR